MSKLIPLTNLRPIVNQQGIMSQESRVFFAQLSERVASFGEGIPEGAVSAVQGATYYDVSAVQGQRHYIKLLDDINGDSTLGWGLA